ncbi:PadR family transcriptional regulator [Paenibacillus wynnii]|uniref:PadR family transcriptional regulator n=1 Tax=Paenibacillus wynnii TaxID=268407 RepID=A0A098M6Y4_9BACL|nr:PadR family transcriptional regulator [Paenibacillus wynnii]KGE17312.1 PadR family transcriptional regulator [Paenibacillus wynnii]
MKEQIYRKLFLGFIQIHILHHAAKEPIYGSWMLDELQEHRYKMSAGTLYPLLRTMETSGLLEREDRNVGGKIRKYYRTTEIGNQVLAEARSKAYDLFKEKEN